MQPITHVLLFPKSLFKHFLRICHASLYVIGRFSLTLIKPASQSFGRATNSPRTSVQNMGVNHRLANVAMAQQFLHSACVLAVRKEVRGKRMPECVAGGLFGESGRSDGGRRCSLNQRFIDVMTTLFASLRIAPTTFLREHEMPTPLAVRVGIFAGQGMR